MRDPSASEETAHPEIVVECEIVGSVEAAHFFPERTPVENLGLHPLPLFPPDTVDIEHLLGRSDSSRVPAGHVAFGIDPLHGAVHEIDVRMRGEKIQDSPRRARSQQIVAIEKADDLTTHLRHRAIERVGLAAVRLAHHGVSGSRQLAGDRRRVIGRGTILEPPPHGVALTIQRLEGGGKEAGAIIDRHRERKGRAHLRGAATIPHVISPAPPPSTRASDKPRRARARGSSTPDSPLRRW